MKAIRSPAKNKRKQKSIENIHYIKNVNVVVTIVFCLHIIHPSIHELGDLYMLFKKKKVLMIYKFSSRYVAGQP
jgi:hypothetical protein